MEAIKVSIPAIMSNAFVAHKQNDDREQFVHAAFNTFSQLGGGVLLKQLVAIKRDTSHELYKDKDCRDILEQNWFLFVTQIMNFGRACPRHNMLITDEDQKEHDDGGVQFLHSADFHIFHSVMRVRNYPKDLDPFLSIAMDIRQDFVNQVLKKFVQPTSTETKNSLTQLVDVTKNLLDETLKLKLLLSKRQEADLPAASSEEA